MIKNFSIAILCTLVFLGACKKNSDESQVSSTNQESLTNAGGGQGVTTESEADETEWVRVPLINDTVSVEGFKGVPVKRGKLGGDYFYQKRGPIYLSVYRGSVHTIENWKKNFSRKPDATLGPAENLKVCGIDAVKMSANLEIFSHPSGHRRPESDAAPSGPPTIRVVPAKTIVVLGFVHNEVPIMVGYRIDTRERDAYKKIEERYFASINCEVEAPAPEKKAAPAETKPE